MRTFFKLLALVPLLLALVACDYDSEGGLSDGYASEIGGNSSDIPGQGQAGVVTAGEWNDLDNWSFWKELGNDSIYSTYAPYWHVYTNKRVGVRLSMGENPVINAELELKKGEYSIWKARTDNLGRAELWIALFQQDSNAQISEYQLYMKDQLLLDSLISFDQGWNEISLTNGTENTTRVELAFVVDATGSMSDELEFLKQDLQDVLDQVTSANANLDLYTAAVFYRDEQDEYVVKHSDFTSETSSTIDYIGEQRADAGGDYPEAVHTALNTAINELQWSAQSRTRIAFLLLDAPPHYQTNVLNDIHESLELAASKGIKIIPITASGIDKETEFLMRFIAMVTNGTYVFITNDSGVGNDHLKASVGEYQVELLNELMIRLITKYSD